MKAQEARLLDVIENSPQFQIPLYQRMYSWTEKECKQLWNDILRAGANDNIKVHFIGSIVYIDNGVGVITRKAPVLVIDGQQRLTTSTLLLAALRDAVGESEPFDGFSAEKILSYYLVNEKETDDRYHKLVLSQTDDRSLKSIIMGNDLPKEHSIRIKENYELFKKWLLDKDTDLETVCKGVAKLVVVDISLTREQDNPQLIFESMNSTGKELSQADLIRNFILMGLEPELQTRLYNDYWRRMELDFGQEAYTTHFDAFMRHYLTVKTGEIPKIDAVYEAFKAFTHSTKSSDVTGDEHIKSVVHDIRDYAKYFCALALHNEGDVSLSQAFHDVRELKVDVAYPFLLELYRDYENALLTKDELHEVVRMVEAYVFRRAICNIPTNSMNKTFATFMKALDKQEYLESIKAHFLLLPSYRRFPTDEEFNRDMQVRDLYNFRSRSYWLRRFENHGRKEYVPVNEYTIEHIMPQNENLNDKWKEVLGEDWERVQQTYLHTLGNLTLTGYNSEYSDRPFLEKRDMDGGFRQSPLRLNEELGTVEDWNEDTIKTRAQGLATYAVTVWKGIELPQEVLDTYKEEPVKQESYTIDDHQYLSEGSSMYGDDVRKLFDAFRKEVLALDPGVTEEFLKLYVAYKAETNFVDVVPQAKCLRLTINMKFSEINDPKGICMDVTNMGRWGNGDVDVKISTIDEMPYVLGLVRQSLEAQLGNETH